MMILILIINLNIILDGFICNFENDMCGWKQLAGSTVNWVRKNGQQYGGGPKYDQ